MSLVLSLVISSSILVIFRRLVFLALFQKIDKKACTFIKSEYRL